MISSSSAIVSRSRLFYERTSELVLDFGGYLAKLNHVSVECVLDGEQESMMKAGSVNTTTG